MLVGVVLLCDGCVRVRVRGREKRVRVQLRILTISEKTIHDEVRSCSPRLEQQDAHSSQRV